MQAWALGEELGDLAPCVADRAPPARAATLGLLVPFQQVEQEAFQVAHDGAAVTASQALDLLGEVFQVQGGEVLGAQGCGLRLRPPVEIDVIIAHRPSPPRCGTLAAGPPMQPMRYPLGAKRAPGWFPGA